MKASEIQTSERTIQRQIVQWADIQAGSVPELHALFAIPNGQYRRGERPEPGLKAGVPDLVLAVQRGEWGALYIELKSQSGRLRKSQKAWRDRLQEHGQAWALCRSFDDAKCCIMDYLDGSFRPDLYAG